MRLYLVLLAALFCVADLALAQQVTAPLTNPNLQLQTNGYVYSVVRLPDGGVVFGGDFQSVNGVPRSGVGRLRADGSLDPDWHPSTSGAVYALAVDGNNNVYIGGQLSQIGGLTRNAVAKVPLAGTGDGDPDWNASVANGAVRAILVSGGKAYLGGNFNFLGVVGRNGIARVAESDGALDASWDPNATGGEVSAFGLAGSYLYVGGNFTNIGGVTRSGLAKVGVAGGAVDATWNPAVSGSSIRTLAFNDTASNLYVGGYFSSIGGRTRSNIAKLQTAGTGAADATWNPQADNWVFGIAVDAGNVYAVGLFTSIGARLRTGLAKLSGIGAGTADDTWNPSSNDSAATIAAGNGKVHVGGGFGVVSGQTRLAFATLDANTGVPDPAADAEHEGMVWALARQANAGGGLIVGGDFYKVNGQPRAHLLRLLADGTLDPNWNAATDGTVYALATEALSGDVFAGGNFKTVNGQARAGLARLSGSGAGALDAAWNPASYGFVLALALDAAGNVIVGGNFNSMGGLSRANVAKVSPGGVGQVDPIWNPSVMNTVLALTVAPSGDVYLGFNGLNATVGGQARSGIARVSGTGAGAVDMNWNPSPTGPYVQVFALAFDTVSNSIYAGGAFSAIGGQNRQYVAKLSASGAGNADSAWDAMATPGIVHALLVDSTGNVYVGGQISNLGGQGRDNLARLSGATGAADPAWNASTDGGVFALSFAANGNLYAGGWFSRIGSKVRQDLAALPFDRIFASDLE